jgi:cytochrome c2
MLHYRLFELSFCSINKNQIQNRLKRKPDKEKIFFTVLRFCQYAVIFLHPFNGNFSTFITRFVNMIDRRSLIKTILPLVILFLVFSIGNKGLAQSGQQLFTQNCASCHHPLKDGTGPALQGWDKRGPWAADKKNVYAWVHNPAAFMAKDPYTQALKAKFGGVMMQGFASLPEKDIDAILAYVNDFKPAGPATPTAGGQTETGDNSLLFGILTLILAVVALILLQVNSNLKKLSDDREGVPAIEPVPFYRNKAYIALGIVVLFLVGGYFTVKGAIGLGRNKDYQPVQPIFYSHKVHAGTNQISCLYCHTGAEEGKHANIPSLNTCMNCHMNINEYTGEKIYREDGTEVNGTAEIQKIYKAVGFEPGKNSNTWNMDLAKAKPVEWAKIHNLPDHVFFSHAQHVKAGKVQCQTCHGEIQKMDEVKQFADLSMGWCINCHRTTQVQFKENGFYSIYEKYHNQLKNGQIDSTKGITADMIGATECQKCHY